MFTLPAVNCYAASRGVNLWQSRPLIILSDRHAVLRLEMRMTSDGLKILIDEAEVGVEVLLRSLIPSSSKQLLCKGKQSQRKLLLLLLPREKFNKQNEKCFLPAHPYFLF